MLQFEVIDLLKIGVFTTNSIYNTLVCELEDYRIFVVLKY